MSVMPSIGVLKPMPAASPITIVGYTTDHTRTGSTSILLPAGCVAGDYAVIALTRFNTTTITPPTGATGLLTNFNIYTSTNYADIYGYTLTSTDITNGNVSFSANSTSNLYTLMVLRGANVSPVDVIGTATAASPNNVTPNTCPANSITTIASGDLVLAFGLVVFASTTSPTWTGPSGWTAQSASTLSYSFQVAIYSISQPTAGATINAPIVISAGTNIRCAGVQIAFKS